MELKECPFCGNKERYVAFCAENNTKFWRCCSVCGVSGPLGNTMEDADNKWNTRYEEKEVENDFSI